ncbi:MAG: hypothetical protein HRT45_09985 [Bdellovibrionales bacterium]|nr:hypothetical protein [Bdellovibrionales bacterium]
MKHLFSFQLIAYPTAIVLIFALGPTAFACVTAPNILTLDAAQFNDSTTIDLQNNCQHIVRVITELPSRHTRQIRADQSGSTPQVCIDGSVARDENSVSADRDRADNLSEQFDQALAAPLRQVCQGGSPVDCVPQMGAAVTTGLRQLSEGACAEGRCDASEAIRTCEQARFDTQACTSYYQEAQRVANELRPLLASLDNLPGETRQSNDSVSGEILELCASLFGHKPQAARATCSSFSYRELIRTVERYSSSALTPNCNENPFNCLTFISIERLNSSSGSTAEARIEQCGASLQARRQSVLDLQSEFRQATRVTSSNTYSYCGDIPNLDAATGVRPLDITNGQGETVGRIVIGEDGRRFQIVSRDPQQAALSFSFEGLQRTITAHAITNGPVAGQMTSQLDNTCSRNSLTAVSTDITGRSIATVVDNNSCGGSIEARNEALFANPGFQLNGVAIDQENR